MITRFDRIGTAPGAIQRLVQYDFCQLSGTPASVKYESEGGPGLQRSAEIIREESVQPAVDLRRLVDWVFFNIFVGNNDSHAKNLSIYHHPRKGATLTPFYDLVCTRVYKTLPAQFALAIGGQRNPGNIERRHIVAMAETLGLRSDYAFDRAESMAARIPEPLEMLIAELDPHLDDTEKSMSAGLRKLVLATTKRSIARVLRKG